MTRHVYNKTLEEKFLSKVFRYIRDDNECWLWCGSISKHGYGRLEVAGEQWTAHRLAFLLFRGKVKKGEFICHKCDVRHCVNPFHLYKGSPQQNSRDMAIRGRSLPGTKNPQAKLNNSRVRLMRLLSADGASDTYLSRIFKVNRGTVYRIKKGLKWRHLL